MTEPTSLQILIIGLVLVGGICSIIIACMWWYVKDVEKNPGKHKDDFKLRNSSEVKE